MNKSAKTQRLINTNAHRIIPWAWSTAWLLTALGIWLSDITSSPSRSVVAYIVLGAVGWGIAGVITVRASRSKASPLLQLAAWAVADLVAIILGRVWLQSWNNAFLGFSVAISAAGVIGGIATSLRPGLWRLFSGVLLGVLFFVLTNASLYATYFLMILYTWFAQRYANIPLLISLCWLIPGAIFGLCAGFAVRWILGLNPINSTGPST